MTAFAIAGNEDLMDASVPRGRIGNEDDAAGTAIYLCSKASSWVTGQTIVLDGGMVAAAG
jgi:NAD(P)-dependent dehydrogenase (short-subunit alcohol dehydrogenase family)